MLITNWLGRHEARLLSSSYTLCVYFQFVCYKVTWNRIRLLCRDMVIILRPCELRPELCRKHSLKYHFDSCYSSTLLGVIPLRSKVHAPTNPSLCSNPYFFHSLYWIAFAFVCIPSELIYYTCSQRDRQPHPWLDIVVSCVIPQLRSLLLLTQNSFSPST